MITVTHDTEDGIDRLCLSTTTPMERISLEAIANALNIHYEQVISIVDLNIDYSKSASLGIEVKLVLRCQPISLSKGSIYGKGK